MTFTVLDLFSGVGGFASGFQQAGFEIKTAIEIDNDIAAWHRVNFPDCQILVQDIRQVNNLPYHDVIIGGSPCQGFSMAGKRKLLDPRNNLVNEFARIVLEVKPNYFVFENVEGILRGEQKKILEGMVAQVKAEGYEVIEPIKVLNGKDYGTAQKRKRVFVIGYKKGNAPPDYPKPSTLKLTVKDVIGDLENINLNDPRYPLHIGSVHNPDVIARFKATVPGEKEPISRFYKLKEDGFANTLRAGTTKEKGGFTAPRPIHYKHPRCVSVMEFARLQGFSDDFKFPLIKQLALRMIGNSVQPPVAKAIAQCLNY